MNSQTQQLTRLPIQVTETGTWHGSFPEGAKILTAMWHGQKINVSYELEGRKFSGYVSPSFTQDKEQFARQMRELYAV